MDVVLVPLKDAAGQIGLVGVAAPEFADAGVIEAEGLEEVVGKCLGVEWRFRELGNGFFDFDCIHSRTARTGLTISAVSFATPILRLSGRPLVLHPSS